MSTWDAAHQNAAVFMRNLGPLARAPPRVRRRKRKAVVISTVYGATAKDGVMQPRDQLQQLLPNLLTLPHLLQDQCSTKPSPTIPVSAWPQMYPSGYEGTQPMVLSLLQPPPSPPTGREEEEEGGQRPLLLSQNPGFWVPQPHLPTVSPLARNPGISVPVCSFCSHCQTTCPGIQLPWPPAPSA